MKSRMLGRTGLEVSPIAIGGAPFAYVHEKAGWNPRSEEGRKIVWQTLNTALDNGVTYFDTAPLYGDGHSETLFGEVMKTRRKDCTLASKVWYELDGKGVTQSIEDSLRRLQTDHIDIMQIHGRMYTPAEIVHIETEVLPALHAAKAAGKIGHIGVTSEEPFCLIPFLANPEIEVFQIAYNLITQGAARHFLIEAQKVNAGVVTMRTMTSGIFQREMKFLAPELSGQMDLYDLCLRFALSDSRVHVGILGARWPEEVLQNVRTATDWVPPTDFAEMPRVTFGIYAVDDKE